MKDTCTLSVDDIYDEDELLGLAFLRDDWCVDSELEVEDWFCCRRFKDVCEMCSSKSNSLTVTSDKVVLYVEWIE
jgi:hypothetical protein